MLFPWTTQQFCELSVGCKSGSCWEQASQEGQWGKSCTLRHNSFNAKNKLRFREMSWYFFLAHFTFGKLLISPIFVALFIWLSLSPSVLCNLSITTALLATLQPIMGPDFHKTNVRKKQRERERGWHCRREQAVLPVRQTQSCISYYTVKIIKIWE